MTLYIEMTLTMTHYGYIEMILISTTTIVIDDVLNWNSLKYISLYEMASNSEMIMIPLPAIYAIPK